ncbi:hypothetical protein EDB92DRAFT_1816292 [Lactarius akahatsu]|uniref:Uncharacterized protein n=1 Tax=Lactarius akahatsu TaxID=416441 RepID=A0AAD4LGZ1_9AGAM|nr:hypothetical protein EDB92DRAFT_1816292 [Lactarius akahatsu]
MFGGDTNIPAGRSAMSFSLAQGPLALVRDKGEDGDDGEVAVVYEGHWTTHQSHIGRSEHLVQTLGKVGQFKVMYPDIRRHHVAEVKKWGAESTGSGYGRLLLIIVLTKMYRRWRKGAAIVSARALVIASTAHPSHSLPPTLDRVFLSLPLLRFSGSPSTRYESPVTSLLQRSHGASSASGSGLTTCRAHHIVVSRLSLPVNRVRVTDPSYPLRKKAKNRAQTIGDSELQNDSRLLPRMARITRGPETMKVTKGDSVVICELRGDEQKRSGGDNNL